MKSDHTRRIDDVELAYQVLLGRRAESRAVCESQVGPSDDAIIQALWNSPEFVDDVLGKLAKGEFAGDRFRGYPTPRQIRWIAEAFSISGEGEQAALASIGSWPDLYRILLGEGSPRASMARLALRWAPDEMLDHLDKWPVTFPKSTERSAFGSELKNGGDSPESGDGEAVAVPADFDPAIYGRYEDAAASTLGLRRHFASIGRAQGRVFNSVTHAHRRKLIDDALDTTFYRLQRPGVASDTDMLDDWIFHGSVNGLDPSRDFSPAYYLDTYADLADAEVDPFEHYLSWGKAEGRLGSFLFGHLIRQGRKPWNLAAPTIVLACHEASRTGAPLVGLALLRSMSKTHNVIVILPKGGEILEDFVDDCVEIVIGRMEPSDAVILLRELQSEIEIDGIILNSVECSPLAPAALHNDIPSVGLIHEFASYTMPAGRMTLMAESIDTLVVPAGVIRDALQHEATTHRGAPLNNIVVRPQGYLPRDIDEKSVKAQSDLSEEDIRSALGIDAQNPAAIVLGAGYVQIRKGVDLFAQAAAEIKRRAKAPVKFVWVGAGYDSVVDGNYSLWLKNMVSILGVEDDILFLPAQTQVDVLMNMADAFLLSSRMDPFPNVALDALAADKPVVCFARGTGIAEAIETYGFAGGVAPFADVHAAADLIVAALEAGPLHGRNRALIDEHFAFEPYAVEIMRLLEGAKASVARRMEMGERIAEGGCFDAKFHQGVGKISAKDEAATIREYVARGDKGLFGFNPRPGFNEAAGRAAGVSAPSLLGAGHDGNACPTTHRTHDLDRASRQAARSKLSVALHLHMHYPDLAGEFAALFRAAELKADLLVTTNSRQARIECDFAFREYKGGRIEVIEVDNVGRDVTPFVVDFAERLELARYDVIGHFHGKQSIVNIAGLGNRWRQHLTSTLIGEAANLSKVLGLFRADPKLGLIFAEDRHVVGWSKNRPFGETLAARLTPRPILPDHPIFPLGTMFWARPQALQSLWDAQNPLAGVPREPLPYDGTILHAFERMLPAIVESNGFDWLTVHRGGKCW